MNTTPLAIIINVDDLGLHPAVHRAVADLAGRGTVTSTTLLANGPAFEHAVGLHRQIIEQGAPLGIGVHCNVLRGRPLSPPAQVSTLTGGNGLFLGSYPALFARYVSNRIDYQQLENEWRAQIRRVVDAGIRPTHLDSEKHTHAWPAFMRIAQKLAAEFNIHWVRRPRERSPLTRLDTPGIRCSFLNACASLHKKHPDVAWPDTVWGIADQKDNLLPEALDRHLDAWAAKSGGTKKTAPRVLEICCHPGLPVPEDPALPAEFGHMRVDQQWTAEYQSLATANWKKIFRRHNARLVHYGQLCPHTRKPRHAQEDNS